MTVGELRVALVGQPSDAPVCIDADEFRDPTAFRVRSTGPEHERVVYLTESPSPGDLVRREREAIS